MSTLIEKRNLLEEFQSAFTKRGLQSHPARLKAMDWLIATGLPGPKTEEYRFTPIVRNLEKIVDLKPEIFESREITPDSFRVVPDLVCNVVAFVNGRYSKKYSHILDQGLHINILEALESQQHNDPFDLLNCAFAPEAIHISVDQGISITHPVAVVYYFDASSFVFSNPRWRCTVGNNSSLTLLEYEINSANGPHFNNKHAEISVGEHAQLEYTILQAGHSNEVQMNNTHIKIASKALASCFTFSFGGQLLRNNLTLTLDGQGIDAHLYGLYQVDKNTLVDNHTVVDHRKPNSYSNQLYKGVMDGNSKGVFNGKVYVRPDAQKTNAFQSNRNILLGENSTVNTKPQLEIWADDVKCSHGCTTGQLDEEALFYLQSRGIGKEMARGMLLHAFGSETVASMKNQVIKTFIEGLISSKLNPNN